MSNEQDWRTPVDAGDYFLGQQKRLDLADRRPVIRRASDLVGPGINSQAVPLADFNGALGAVNGYYVAEAGADNAPTGAEAFIGTVVMDPVLGGWQRFIGLTSGDVYERVLSRSPVDPTHITFGAWVGPPVLSYGQFTRATDQSITAGGSYVIPWEARTDSTGLGVISYSGTDITIPRAGMYLLMVELQFASPAATQRIAMRLRSGGAELPGGVTLVSITPGNTHVINATLPVPLAQNAQISVVANIYGSNGTLTNSRLIVTGPLAAA